MDFYQRKLYALLQAPELRAWGEDLASQLTCLNNDLSSLQTWWGQSGDRNQGGQAQDIASSSDRVNLYHIEHRENTQQVTVHHPISGQKQQVVALQLQKRPDIGRIKDELDAEKVFWWFWRFYPELLAATQHDALLFPAHTVIPDCPLHSHQSTVSALTGAMFPESWQIGEKYQTPDLLVFTFSPVQDFIKSSRKFLDFWAGSYLLHYLSTRLCWYIAQQLGPDAVIIPSLWSQEIIDALMIKQYSDFANDFALLHQQKTPTSRFQDKSSTSLSTAGFPNMITVLVSGKDAAQEWGDKLTKKLTEEWVEIGKQVRNCIRERVVGYLKKQTKEDIDTLLREVLGNLVNSSDAATTQELYKQELELLKHESCWEWNKLWDEQLNHTWEPYWAAVPLGSPDLPLITNKQNNTTFDQKWIEIQQEIAQALTNLPSEAESQVYHTLNVGTWWGSLQQRLRLSLQAVKNTRTWQIATAPGERSTISGQLSAVHPRFNYTKFSEGAGIPLSSMRLFWLTISKAFPGMFNGSEKLNALELTKRMAWFYGGVAEALGVDVEAIVKKIKSSQQSEKKVFQVIKENQILYEQLLRFPNLSSIASARFVHDNPQLVREYWLKLNSKIRAQLPDYSGFFHFLTRFRSSKVPKTDTEINPHNRRGRNYNGVMFSSKWLADDMSLQGTEADILKKIINAAHSETGFGDSSPTDWWVILLADGDGMGSYVSGEKLNTYNSYIVKSAVGENIPSLEQLLETQKRMGPATHVGLNRALLDFSNRLVPYLTEKRFCGRVIYSGGDDVKVVLPLEDLPEYVLSLRAAWCGGEDPYGEFTNSRNGTSGNEDTGYWHPTDKIKELPIPKRPHFTMGVGATMSMGVVFAHKSVPLPTVLESLWTAEADRAKKMPDKDGICFRVIYGGGNQLEALMKGELLETWWDWVKEYELYKENLSPLLYRLAEELPRRASITENHHLFSKAAKVIMESRDSSKQLEVFVKIETWLDKWEEWAKKVIEEWAKETLKEQAEKILKESDKKTLLEIQQAQKTLLELEQSDKQTLEHWVKEAKNIKPTPSTPIGTQPEDLAQLLRFTAFWVDKRVERLQWEEKVKS